VSRFRSQDDHRPDRRPAEARRGPLLPGHAAGVRPRQPGELRLP